MIKNKKIVKMVKKYKDRTIETSMRYDKEGRKILVVEDIKTPSEKMQDELEPIADDPDYRAADHWDEIREIEKKWEDINGK
jgi:hypothetical protein